MNNVVNQYFSTSSRMRSEQKNQVPVVIWLTGLSGAGKSTIADALDQKLTATNHHTYLLDGDNVRLGLCKDLGFSDADREENIRRVSEVSRLFLDAGLIVITAFISPFCRDRELAKNVIGRKDFVEVFIDTPLVECERRDPKGLYKKARQGLIRNFTGLDSPYEPPINPHLTIDTLNSTLEDNIDLIIGYLSARLSE